MTANSQDVPADDRSIELARQLGEARKNAKQWGEVADYVRDQLVDHMQELATAAGIDEPKAIVAGGTKVASVTVSTRSVYDYKQAMADHPEIDWESYKRISESTTVRVGNI